MQQQQDVTPTPWPRTVLYAAAGLAGATQLAVVIWLMAVRSEHLPFALRSLLSTVTVLVGGAVIGVAIWRGVVHRIDALEEKLAAMVADTREKTLDEGFEVGYETGKKAATGLNGLPVVRPEWRS